jgi:hypothetical protein
MSSKAQITASINTIETGGNNPASEVRSVFETLNNAFFPSVQTISGTTANGLDYEIKAIKIGNFVVLNGVLTNPFGVWINGGEIALPTNLTPLYVINTLLGTSLNTTTILTVPSTSDLAIGTMNANSVIRFSLTYISNEL